MKNQKLLADRRVTWSTAGLVASSTSLLSFSPQIIQLQCLDSHRMSKHVKICQNGWFILHSSHTTCCRAPKNSAIVHDLWNDAIWTAISVSWRFTENDNVLGQRRHNGTWLMWAMCEDKKARNCREAKSRISRSRLSSRTLWAPPLFSRQHACPSLSPNWSNHLSGSKSNDSHHHSWTWLLLQSRLVEVMSKEAITKLLSIQNPSIERHWR